MTFATRVRRALTLTFTTAMCAAALLAPASASAAIVAAQTAPSCDNYNSLTNWGPHALTVSQFDASKGTLTAVTVTRAVSMQTDYTITSKDNASQTIPISVDGTATIDLTGTAQLSTHLSQSRTLVFPAGTSTQSGTLGPSTASTSDNLTNFAAWTGLGTVTAFANATAQQTSHTTGNATVDINTTANVQMCVVYSYTYEVKVCIGDYVWIDANENGIQDPGEQPVPARNVTVHDAGGAVIGTATTAADGTWKVCNLEPNTACDITVSIPSGWSLTTAGAGTDRAKDSNGVARGTDAGIACVTPPSGSDLTFDVGINTAVPSVADTPGGAPSMRVKKAAKSRSVKSRGKVVFSVSVTNAGTATAHNVAVCDIPPTQLAFVTRPKGSYTSHGKLCWRVKVLKAKATARFSYQMRAANVMTASCVTNAATAVPSTGRTGSAKAKTCIRPGKVGTLLLAG